MLRGATSWLEWRSSPRRWRWYSSWRPRSCRWWWRWWWSFLVKVGSWCFLVEKKLKKVVFVVVNGGGWSREICGGENGFGGWYRWSVWWSKGGGDSLLLSVGCKEKKKKRKWKRESVWGIYIKRSNDCKFCLGKPKNETCVSLKEMAAFRKGVSCV